MLYYKTAEGICLELVDRKNKVIQILAPETPFEDMTDSEIIKYFDDAAMIAGILEEKGFVIR